MKRGGLLVNCSKYVACVAFCVSCGGTARPSKQAHQSTSDERLLTALKNGTSLYGLGPGCGEWHSRPGEPYIYLTEENVRDDGRDGEDGSGENDNSSEIAEEEARDLGWLLRGRIEGHMPDAAGPVRGFSYFLVRDHGRLRMGIVGRDTRSSPPNTASDSPKNGVGVIGSARNCTLELEISAHPQDPDAVLVGRETWYLSHEACLRGAAQSVIEGCSEASHHGRSFDNPHRPSN